MADVFDGKVCMHAFFSTAGNLGVMLKVDWFQPYKHTNHSCGVMYLVLMNLPREERLKPENVIIVGIIPGPKVPTFLKCGGFAGHSAAKGTYNVNIIILQYNT